MLCEKLIDFIFSKMSDYDDIENEIDNDVDQIDEMSLELDDNDVFEDNEEVSTILAHKPYSV